MRKLLGVVCAQGGLAVPDILCLTHAGRRTCVLGRSLAVEVSHMGTAGPLVLSLAL